MMAVSIPELALVTTSIVLLFAFAFWTQWMIRYNARMYAIVTRYMRPGEKLRAWEWIGLLLVPVGDPQRLAARVTPQGVEHLEACATLRRHIWQAVAVFLLAALVMWIVRG